MVFQFHVSDFPRTRYRTVGNISAELRTAVNLDLRVEFVPEVLFFHNGSKITKDCIVFSQIRMENIKKRGQMSKSVVNDKKCVKCQKSVKCLKVCEMSKRAVKNLVPMTVKI